MSILDRLRSVEGRTALEKFYREKIYSDDKFKKLVLDTTRVNFAVPTPVGHPSPIPVGDILIRDIPAIHADIKERIFFDAREFLFPPVAGDGSVPSAGPFVTPSGATIPAFPGPGALYTRSRAGDDELRNLSHRHREYVSVRGDTAVGARMQGMIIQLVKGEKGVGLDIKDLGIVLDKMEEMAVTDMNRFRDLKSELRESAGVSDRLANDEDRMREDIDIEAIFGKGGLSRHEMINSNEFRRLVEQYEMDSGERKDFARVITRLRGVAVARYNSVQEGRKKLQNIIDKLGLGADINKASFDKLDMGNANERQVRQFLAGTHSFDRRRIATGSGRYDNVVSVVEIAAGSAEVRKRTVDAWISLFNGKWEGSQKIRFEFRHTVYSLLRPHAQKIYDGLHNGLMARVIRISDLAEKARMGLEAERLLGIIRNDYSVIHGGLPLDIPT